MRSPLTTDDAGHGALINVKELRDLGVVEDSASHMANPCDFIISQFAMSHRNEPAIDTVDVVSDSAGPFKVGSSVVDLEAIKVVHLGKPIRIWNESQRDESMDRDVAGYRGFAQVDLRVSAMIGLSRHDPALEISAPYASGTDSDHFLSDAIQAAHSPKVTDLVETREGINLYGFPFFIHCRDSKFISGTIRYGADAALAQ